jgi:N-acetylgalactosamine-6-sulfatase
MENLVKKATVLLGLAAALLAPLCGLATKENKPNFIFIMTDDQGWGDLGCYGHPVLRTPHLDRLAKEGSLFTQFYAPASICSPTRAGVMTGQFPGRVGFHSQVSTEAMMKQLDASDVLDPKYAMLPRSLQQAGYHTMHIGKWHLSEWLHKNPQLPRPDAYGFSEYLLPYLNWPACKYGEKWSQKTHRCRSSELFVDEAINYVDRREQDGRPFFLNIWLVDPHTPLLPEKDQMRHYDDLKVKQPYDDNTDDDPYRIYWNVLTEMDKQLGRLFERIRRSGLSENTYIIFSSDNGAPNPLSYNYYVGVGSNGPLRGEKANMYEGGFRVPFIIWRPGTVPAARVDNDSVTSMIDFFPTMCALGGAELPGGLDGIDVQSVWHGQAMEERPASLMWEWRYGQPQGWLNRSPMLAIREGDWKLLVNPDGSRKELYNIPLDPSETANVAASHPEIAGRLAAKVIDYHKSLPGKVVDPNGGKVGYRWPK